MSKTIIYLVLLGLKTIEFNINCMKIQKIQKIQNQNIIQKNWKKFEKCTNIFCVQLCECHTANTTHTHTPLTHIKSENYDYELCQHRTVIRKIIPHNTQYLFDFIFTQDTDLYYYYCFYISLHQYTTHLPSMNTHYFLIWIQKYIHFFMYNKFNSIINPNPK